MSVLNIIRNEQAIIKDSVDNCHDRINECNQLLKQQEVRLSVCINKIEDVEAQQVALSNENIELKQKINDLEQYLRRNTVEIKGVPEARNENILTVVQAVGTVIGFDISKQMIDACHRIGAASQVNNTRPIIVKFVSRLDKDEFVSKRRVKRNLVVGDLLADIARLGRSDSPIYINDSLTQTNRILFFKANLFKKENNIKYLWCRNGKILMRQEDKSRVYEIRTEKDFNDVH
ncbi:hypothetical protein RI129_002259 [Pyrocoelia pectoralis]|uniref:FP protein C-terminal domain-containing protein n=1 Tax=Pyrocoelia pectoralis TaxID=417401 RepID=A0AAN7VGA2_9COLE